MHKSQNGPATGAEGRGVARAERLSLLAKAPAARLAALWAACGLEAEAGAWRWLRPPETGAVMVRGRAGGTGEPFNLGEMTATRCTLRLAGGEIGHGWTAGRDKTKARTVALCDALAETPAAEALEAAVLAPLRAEAEAADEARAARAAATKVEFFTLVRGESV